MFPFTRLLDLLCPPVCTFCGTSLEQAEPFCTKCTESLVTPEGKFCLRCGGRRFQRTWDTELKTDACKRCRTTDFRFRRAVALGEYERELRSAVLRMKTDRTGLLVRSAAELLWRYRETELREAMVDFIVPIPMHRSRRFSRGVNAPDLLAEELARKLKIPIFQRLVRRHRATDLQYMLSARDRQTNVDGAFVLGKSNDKIGKRFGIEGKNALLVDDILTTGATCNEVAKLLRRTGVRDVTVCILARAEGIYDDFHAQRGEKR